MGVNCPCKCRAFIALIKIMDSFVSLQEMKESIIKHTGILATSSSQGVRGANDEAIYNIALL
ncbi:hypothetical protein [Helicobacter rodentium]|uniref:hypothetical protein n=1 Tax=Helicobacter rodentium TaxID=59617 RepID=UPI002557E925|nr:hypothetical protein [Helicobacter rodentium]